MASSEILSATLRSVTAVKLRQLDKQKTAYESAKRTLLEKASAEKDARERIKHMLDSAGDLAEFKGSKASSDISLPNLHRFVEQARYDPSVSESLLLKCESSITRELEVQSYRYQYAELYGRLVNEWIASEAATSADATAFGYFSVGREEMHTQRAAWEKYVFEAKPTDSSAITDYLRKYFVDASQDISSEYQRLRDSIAGFESEWDKDARVDEESLKQTIEGLLQTDVLTDEKRATLMDFRVNKTVLKELVDILKMRLQAWRTWEWDSVSKVDQRRQLNGRYRFYPDDDLIDSLLVFYVGRVWGVVIRAILRNFFLQKKVQESTVRGLRDEEVRRWRFFLNDKVPTDNHASVEVQRREHFEDEIFLDQLPREMGETRSGYGEEADERGEEATRDSHAKIVQRLLQLLQSEILMQTRLGRDTTVIRSDFKWFGPSIPHDSLLTVLRFFGVSKDWLNFFRKVLEAPLKLRDDPEDVGPRIRKRGIPLSTPLADMMTETMLFCLDFAVNQDAGGMRLYRLHDDMWLYGSQDSCVKAWESVLRFNDVMGLDLNEEKTGSACIAAHGGPDAGQTGRQAGLPKGDVVWGFLKLDPSRARFVIDQTKVDTHIDELKLQLNACKSVFDWIQAWNIYGSRFFRANFGQLAHCYPRAHAEDMLVTLHRIQAALFGDGGSVGAHLQKMISERFGVRDVPEGYLYLPVVLGGLGLDNPFVHINLVLGEMDADPGVRMDRFFASEAKLYREYERAFQERAERWSDDDFGGREYEDLRQESFFSLEEFARHREHTSHGLGSTFLTLRSPLVATQLEPSTALLATAAPEENGRNWWSELGDYEKWVCTLYATEMVQQFGSLRVVDQDLLPTGLMEMVRQSRFQWLG